MRERKREMERERWDARSRVRGRSGKQSFSLRELSLNIHGDERVTVARKSVQNGSGVRYHGKLSLFRKEKFWGFPAAIRAREISDVASIDTLRDVLAESETEIDEAGFRGFSQYYSNETKRRLSYILSPFFCRENFASVSQRDRFPNFSRNRMRIGGEEREVSMRRARNSRKMAQDRRNRFDYSRDWSSKRDSKTRSEPRTSQCPRSRSVAVDRSALRYSSIGIYIRI